MTFTVNHRGTIDFAPKLPLRPAAEPLRCEDAGHQFHGNQWSGVVYHGTNNKFDDFDDDIPF